MAVGTGVAAGAGATVGAGAAVGGDVRSGVAVSEEQATSHVARRIPTEMMSRVICRNDIGTPFRSQIRGCMPFACSS